MGFIVDFHNVIGADVDVFLGGGQALMSQEFLDTAQVRAIIEQVGGKGMPQGMRAGAGRDAGALAVFFDQQVHPASAQAAAMMVEKQGLLLLHTTTLLTDLEVGLERLRGRFAKKDLALALAFALDA